MGRWLCWVKIWWYRDEKVLGGGLQRWLAACGYVQWVARWENHEAENWGFGPEDLWILTIKMPKSRCDLMRLYFEILIK